MSNLLVVTHHMQGPETSQKPETMNSFPSALKHSWPRSVLQYKLSLILSGNLRN